MRPISRHAYAALAIVLSIVIFVAVNMASDALFTTAKLDLTANGQFTLAQGTRNILANLKEPVTLKFYYSKQVASEYATTADYAKRVRDCVIWALLLNGVGRPANGSATGDAQGRVPVAFDPVALNWLVSM